MFDRDGNGFISKQELGMAMRSLGYMPNEVELEVIIQRLDMDGEETLTQAENGLQREKTRIDVLSMECWCADVPTRH